MKPKPGSATWLRVGDRTWHRAGDGTQHLSQVVAINVPGNVALPVATWKELAADTDIEIVVRHVSGEGEELTLSPEDLLAPFAMEVQP